MIRVILAEDHALVRAGIRSILELTGEVVVIAEVSDGLTAVRAVEALAPDVAILDVSMPRCGGLEALQIIVAEHPGTRCLMLTAHRSDAYIAEAFRLGALGYVLKSADVIEFGLAIRTVAAGTKYVSRDLTARGLVVEDRTARGIGTPLGVLTRRQRDVLRLIASGASTKSAAATLGLSPKTVEAHRSQLMDRLGIRDIPGLVRYALRHGIVDSTPDAEP